METIDVWVVEYDANDWIIDDIYLEKTIAEHSAKYINDNGHIYKARVRHATLRFDEEPQP